MLSLPAGTEMFHFPAFPPPALCVQAGVMDNYVHQVSPFGNPRIKAWLPAPRGISQAPTSFFGSWCQGIHRVPLITWQLQRCSRPLCSSQDAGGTGIRFAAYPGGPVSVPDDPARSARLPGPFGGKPTQRPRADVKRPFPQDPTACSAWTSPRPPFLPGRRPAPRGAQPSARCTSWRE